MQFTLDKKELTDRLALFHGIIEKNSAVPILGAVLLATMGSDQISVSGTDLALYMKTGISAKVLREGGIVIDLKRFSDIVKTVPEGPVKMELLDDDIVQIAFGSLKFKLSGYKPDDYPVFQEVKEEFGFDITREAFARMVDKTSFASGGSDPRYALEGLLLDYRNDGECLTIRFVGTDGNRLAVATHQVIFPLAVPYDSSPALEKRGIVPKKGMIVLKALASMHKVDTIHLRLDGKRLATTIGEAHFSVKLLDGNFPDYSKIIPETLSREVTFRKDDLTRSIQRLGLCSRKKVKGFCLKFEIENQKAILRTGTAYDLGEAEDQLQVDYRGDKFITGLNSRYLLDQLSVVQDENISIHFNKPGGPAVFKDPADPDYLGLIMPMRV